MLSDLANYYGPDEFHIIKFLGIFVKRQIEASINYTSTVARLRWFLGHGFRCRSAEQSFDYLLNDIEEEQSTYVPIRRGRRRKELIYNA